MTETAKTKPQRTPDEVQRTPDEPYGVIEMRFLCAEKIVKRGTGEIIEVTDKMRLLYIYMLNQFLGFSAREQSFYKDQREMAAALGWSRGKTGEALAGLKRIGLVGTAGRQGNSEVYTVCFLSDISETLDMVHKDWKGEPAWNHARASKNFKSKKQKPEESKNDGKSKSKEPNHTVVDAATVGNGEHNRLQQLVDHRVDAVSPHDEVSEEDDPPFPEEKQEPKQSPAVQTERNIAHPNKLTHWINGGDDEGFMAYGKLWGETKPRKIADLIRNHYQITQKDEAQGFKSVANNEHSGADIHYRQQQAQKAAAARHAK